MQTSETATSSNDAQIYRSLESALSGLASNDEAEQPETIFVIGGGQVGQIELSSFM